MLNIAICDDDIPVTGKLESYHPSTWKGNIDDDVKEIESVKICQQVQTFTNSEEDQYSFM